jgi:hypothetical protein
MTAPSFLMNIDFVLLLEYFWFGLLYGEFTAVIWIGPTAGHLVGGKTGWKVAVYYPLAEWVCVLMTVLHWLRPYWATSAGGTGVLLCFYLPVFVGYAESRCINSACR